MTQVLDISYRLYMEFYLSQVQMNFYVYSINWKSLFYEALTHQREHWLLGQEEDHLMVAKEYDANNLPICWTCVHRDYQFAN